MSANPLANTVQIKLGGQERSLKFSLNALVAAEQDLGGTVSLLDLHSASQVRSVLWAALVHEDSELTLDAVGDMITSTKEIAAVRKSIRKAWGMDAPVAPLFGGKDRPFKFNMNALAVAERSLGFDLSLLDLRKLSATQFRAVFWAGLLHSDKTLTLEAAGDLVESGAQIAALIVRILESWGLGKQPDPTQANA